jgi:DNA-directed RNA polymerase subunit RPC12/RpoP
MTEDCSTSIGCGCGCNSTSIYTDRDCPTCGRRLRITGDLQRVKLHLNCPDCGYVGHELSVDEIGELIG